MGVAMRIPRHPLRWLLPDWLPRFEAVDWVLVLLFVFLAAFDALCIAYLCWVVL